MDDRLKKIEDSIRCLCAAMSETLIGLRGVLPDERREEALSYIGACATNIYGDMVQKLEKIGEMPDARPVARSGSGANCKKSKELVK